MTLSFLLMSSTFEILGRNYEAPEKATMYLKNMLVQYPGTNISNQRIFDSWNKANAALHSRRGTENTNDEPKQFSGYHILTTFRIPCSTWLDLYWNHQTEYNHQNGTQTQFPTGPSRKTAVSK